MPISYRDGPQTPRLVHRAFEVGDAEVFLELNRDPEIMRYTGEPSLGSVAEAERAIVSYPDFARFGFGRWACVLKETQEVVGFCGLKYLEEQEEVDIGYRFLPSRWGSGLATEASLACLEAWVSG
jgi:RimJ/RimL family protein N-acetyltransferase